MFVRTNLWCHQSLVFSQKSIRRSYVLSLFDRARPKMPIVRIRIVLNCKKAPLPTDEDLSLYRSNWVLSETRPDRDVKHAPDIGRLIRRQSRGPRERQLQASRTTAATASSLSPKGRGHRPDRDLATALHGRTNVHVYTNVHNIHPAPRSTRASGQFVRSDTHIHTRAYHLVARTMMLLERILHRTLFIVENTTKQLAYGFEYILFFFCYYFIVFWKNFVKCSDVSIYLNSYICLLYTS